MTTTLRLLAATFLLVSPACKRDQPPPAEPAATAPVARTIQAAPDQFFIHDSVRLRYREAGQGDPVVILHGFTQRIEGVQDLADSLAPTNRVIVMDLRGFGESTKLSDPARYGPAFGDDVIALLDHLQIPKAHLIGHSMGAMIAADIAVRHPTRVASLSLISGVYGDSAALRGFFVPQAALLEQGQGLKKLLAYLVPGMPDSAVAGLDRQLQAANDHAAMIAVLKAAPALALPTGAKPDSGIRVLIAVGGADPLAPQSRDLEKRWPRAVLVEAAGAGHFDILTRPEVVGAIRTAVAR